MEPRGTERTARVEAVQTRANGKPEDADVLESKCRDPTELAFNERAPPKSLVERRRPRGPNDPKVSYPRSAA